MCIKYWLTAKSSLPKEKVWLDELTISVDWDVKPQTKQETFLAGCNFCHLLINFVSILDPDQD